MCNWSESISERARIEGRMEGILEGRIEGKIEGKIEGRIEAIERMIRANITREQILSMGYTEAEYEKAESALYANA